MRKKLFYTTLIIAILCAISTFICDWTVKKNAASCIYTEISDIPANNVNLLLDTSFELKGGNNDSYFDYRIDATVELYKAGRINYTFISGDSRKEDYGRPKETKKAFTQKGVPEKFIYLDYVDFRTLDSVVRAKEVLGQTRLTIISQQFHSERATYLAEKNGTTAIGFNARDVDVYTGLETNIRELFVRVGMFIDLTIDKQPHSLGGKYKLPSDKQEDIKNRKLLKNPWNNDLNSMITTNRSILLCIQ